MNLIQLFCKHNDGCGLKRSYGIKIICCNCQKVIYIDDKIWYINEMIKYGFTPKEIQTDLRSEY